MPDYSPQAWMDFLDAAMQSRGIKTPAELCRLAGLGQQSIVTRWAEGAQPTNKAIRKLAPVLGVSVRTLLIETGHFEEDELVGGEDPLGQIISSSVLTDRQKLELIEEWRREEKRREQHFSDKIESWLARFARGSESTETRT